MDDKNKNTKQIPKIRKPIEKEGVLYTPSSYTQEDFEKAQQEQERGYKIKNAPANATARRSAHRDLASNGSNRNIYKKPTSRKKKQSSKVAVFFVTVIFVGVIFCAAAFAVVVSSIVSATNEGNAVNKADLPSAIATPIIPVEEKTILTVTAVISSLRSTDKSMELYDIEQEKIYRLFADGTTELRDKYGKIMVFAEFMEGDIVTAAFEEAGNTLISLKASVDAFIKKGVSGIKVDKETSTFTIGNEIYKFNDMMISSYNDMEFNLDNLDPIDVVTVKGYKNNIWHLNVTKSHGVIQVKHREEILNLIIEIDTNIYKAINEDYELVIPEGSHRIVIKGDNIDHIVKDIVLSSNETYVVDLSDVELKSGNLTVSVVNAEDAVLKINGFIKKVDEPIHLLYDKYTIIVEKEGYETYEETIEFHEPVKLIAVELVEIEIIVEEPEPTPEPTEQIETGKVTINTNPQDAEVYVDGQYAGITPISITLEHGTHTISIRKEGYITLPFTLTISDSNDPLFINLQTEDSIITTDPAPGAPIIE